MYTYIILHYSSQILRYCSISIGGILNIKILKCHFWYFINNPVRDGESSGSNLQGMDKDLNCSITIKQRMQYP